MTFKENYNYKFISKDYFDRKCLDAKQHNEIYRKYKIVKYEKNGEILFAEIIFENLIKNIENIIKIYDAEIIISSCNGFDIEYDDLTFYHIEDMYFIEYKNYEFGNDNENELIKKELYNRGLIVNT